MSVLPLCSVRGIDLAGGGTSKVRWRGGVGVHLLVHLDMSHSLT